MTNHVRFFDVAIVLFLQLQVTGVSAEQPDFNRDIRPILADKCFHCHGPDPGTREAELRLDQESAAKDSVIVAGNAADSELIRRIMSTDPEDVMPPPDSQKELTPQQIALLQQWIDGGANWAKHWAFEVPVKAGAPPVSKVDWPRNAIDHFVLAQLDREGLGHSLEATKSTLARRVAFDLTGMPPSPVQVQRFLSDASPDAYEKLVDELLASQHYGERMAMVWLDAARYADSDGYQADATRQNWPWRDWVIDAYHSNMPFDQFTIEQFAGDLLPNASQQQILATCFHRNHMHNGEGGRDPEESRIEYVRDRVNTVGTVWLGLTLECAQCHSHKYDPISQAEYYSLNAFFNSIAEDGKAGGGAAPFLNYESPYVSEGLADSVAWLKQMETQLQERRKRELAGLDDWLATMRTQCERVRSSSDGVYSSWDYSRGMELHSTSGRHIVSHDGVIEVTGDDPRHDDYVIRIDPPNPRVTAIRLTVLPSEAAGGKLSLASDGHIILTNLKVRYQAHDSPSEVDLKVEQAAASFEAAKSGGTYGPIATVLDDDPRTGWMTTGSSNSESKTAVFVLDEPVEFYKWDELIVELRQRSLRGHSNLQKFKLEFTSESISAVEGLEQTPLEQFAELKPEGAIPEMLRTKLQSQFLAERPDIAAAQVAVENAKRRKSQYDASLKPQSVTVLKERDTARDTHVLERGVWNSKGDKVPLSAPAAIGASNATISDRLELAKWLVSKDNPLTARVAVNRYWQMYFGAGLVRTPGDFGTQGEPPTHPELLDWLAVEFMESGWNVKHLQRLIVTSATYRQSSNVSEELLVRDPQNRLLARASRFRLPSWMIRDAALASSGQLERRIGGPPVFSFQPEGAWLDATMGRFRYEPSVGSDLYRRSIYTFWRRSVGPTWMFDASKRRVCEVRSVRTNTPLQALNLMNDETFVQAASALATSALKQNENEIPEDRISAIFERVLLRQVTDEEQAILRRQFELHVAEYIANPANLIDSTSPDSTAEEIKNKAVAAATTVLASTILNLDETITHE